MYRLSVSHLAMGMAAGVVMLPGSVAAQTACIPGVNAGACAVAPGVVFVGSIVTTNPNSSVTNAGSIDQYIQTLSDGSAVANTGSIAQYVITIGVGSGITNSGSIGQYAQTVSNGSAIINSGSIGQFALTTGSGSSLSNSGSIGQYAGTFGANSAITNSGSIGQYALTTSANSSISNSGVIAQYVETLGAGSAITNSGSIGQFALTTSSNASISNSGAVGQYVETLGSGSTVTNSGTIGQFVLTAGTGGSVTNLGSIGQYVQTISNNASVTNYGSIGQFVSAFGTGSSVTNAGTIGQYVQTFGAGNTVTNSGFIGAGLTMFGQDPTLSLLPGSVIVGNIQLLGPGTTTLNVGNGLNAMLSFTANMPTVVNTAGAPYVTSGNRIAVVDPTALGRQGEMLSSLSGGISSSVHARLGGGGDFGNAGAGGGMPFGGMQLGADGIMRLGATPGEGMGASAPTKRSAGAWAQGFGGSRRDSANGPSTASDITLGGGIAGFDAWLTPWLRIGGFGGASDTQLRTPFAGSSVSADSYFGGAYARVESRSWFLSAIISAGQTSNSTTRLVSNNQAPGGVELARGSFDGVFLSPELAAGTRFTLGGIPLEPSIRARYAHVSLDGYAETGASDGFSVKARDVSMWTGRAQMAIPFAGRYGLFAPRFGVETSYSSGENVQAVLLGQSLAFNPGGRKDEVTKFIGALATIPLGLGINAFADGEIHSGGRDQSRSEGRAGLIVKF